MAANSTIDLVSLDPDLNKASLIKFLQTQERFKDYDFTGSDINILLDMLSINTFRHAFFLNMAISEGFNDSAQVASDVRSHAKEVNYCPRSITSAVANITVTFQATGASQPYTIPKGATFSTFVKNQNFTFSLDETLIVASSNSTFTFTANVSEGVYVKDSYIFNNTGNNQIKFPITNDNADTNSLVVNIFENNSTLSKNFNRAISLLDLNSNSNVYFLQASAASNGYEVLFGDGILGYEPQNGALVVFDYRVSSGDKANGSGLFTLNFDPTGVGEVIGSGITVTTNQSAIGGSPAEDVETTRFYAPRWFQAQERAVVPSDYTILLQSQFPEIQAINAYGGETLTPPQFSRTVVSLAIKNVQGLPTSLVSKYTQFLKGRNCIPILPIFVPAQNIYIGVNMIVRYNVNVTTETNTRISSVVQTAITNYSNNNLNNFDVTFRLTNFTTAIANSDPSIVSVPTTISLYQKINPSQTASNFLLNFTVPLANNFASTSTTHASDIEKTLTSTNFFYQGNLSQLEDDGKGTIRIVNISGNNLVTAAVVGTIDYTSGEVNLSNFAVDTYSGSNLLVYVIPQDDDITATQNTLLSIEPSQLQLNIQPLSL